ncbi:hypothetical protein [Kribbella sp. NBC_00889]|uniref:hypothetical protein n=1 Tax=Kribbella sp. NBC_00889 TaxID=2975974 RepID=UPI00386594F1|nr:DUF3466 family protein [Kribbella sp. NBC_00889]
MTLRNRAAVAVLTTSTLALATLLGASAHATEYQPPGSSGLVFVLDGGRCSAFDPPDGVSANEFVDLNDRGQVAGTYSDSDAGASHGFLREKRGRFTRFDAPDAKLTFPTDINDRGQIAGFTTDALPLPTATDIQGFVLKNGPTGPFTRIDYPGASRTIVFGLNDRGSITVVYENPNATPPSAVRPEEDR